jgi:hypothetical protein
MAEDTTTSQSPSDDQTQNEEVEETTAPEPSTEETTEEAPTEETPAEPETEAPAEEPEEADKPEPKGKRAEKRIKGLLERNRDLQDKLAQAQPSQNISQAQAAQGVADLEAYAAQNQGQLPSEISVDDYNHLVAIRDGRAQAQADIQQAQSSQEVAQLKQEIQVEKRTRQVDRDIRDAVDTHDVLNKASAGYDSGFDDLVSDELEEALKENPMLNVRRFIDSKVRVYEKARAKGGEQTTASVAKQAATSALPPQGTPKRKEKSAKEMTTAELEAKIIAEHGVV